MSSVAIVLVTLIALCGLWAAGLRQATVRLQRMFPENEVTVTHWYRVFLRLWTMLICCCFSVVVFFGDIAALEKLKPLVPLAIIGGAGFGLEALARVVSKDG